MKNTGVRDGLKGMEELMKMEIRNLSKAYGSVRALDDFSAVLEEGIYGVLGPNGAGKSTLINILTDNVKRDSGEILLDGREIMQMGAEYRGLVGYMPQDQVFYPQFTLLEFLKYMALVKGLDQKDRAVRMQIDELLEELHLTDAAGRRLGGFSGGMKRRAVLAQALLGNPRIIILDEPTAGLDPKERIAMRNLISRLAEKRIVILATHIASDIECIADRVLLIKEGKLIKNENPFQLLEEVRGHIRRIYCQREELAVYQRQYRMSNCIQTKDGLTIHVIDPEYEGDKTMDATLEDVYLYYFEGMTAQNASRDE